MPSIIGNTPTVDGAGFTSTNGRMLDGWRGSGASGNTPIVADTACVGKTTDASLVTGVTGNTPIVENASSGFGSTPVTSNTVSSRSSGNITVNSMHSDGTIMTASSSTSSGRIAVAVVVSSVVGKTTDDENPSSAAMTGNIAVGDTLSDFGTSGVVGSTTAASLLGT